MGNVYTSAMGMISFQTKLEVVGNNVANSRSTGYKAEHETFKVFEEGVRKILSNDKAGAIGPYQDQVHVDNIYSNFNPGVLEVTNRNLDVSLENKTDVNGNKEISFFEVEIGGERQLTRDGHFKVDEQGNLSLMNGAYVLNTNGQKIQIPDAANVSIDAQGRILNSVNGQEISQIQVRTMNEQNTGFLKKTNGGMFQAMSLEEIEQNFGPVDEMLRVYDINPSLQNILRNKEVLQQAQTSGQINIFSPTNNNVVVRQQTLEQSNVDISYEMNEMLLAQKGFQSNAKALTIIDKINEKDANQLGI